MDERDSPGLPSRANARSWVIGIAVSVVLHIAILALFLLSATREGTLTVKRRPDLLSETASSVTLLALPDATVPALQPRQTHESQLQDAPAPAKSTLGTASPEPAFAANASLASQPAAPPSTMTASQATAVAASAVSTTDAATAGSDYRRRLLEHIATYRRSPAGASPGTVYVRFSLARDGAVLSTSVAVSSGNTILDRVAIDTIRSASPMPAIPMAFPDQLSVMLPVDFGASRQPRD